MGERVKRVRKSVEAPPPVCHREMMPIGRLPEAQFPVMTPWLKELLDAKKISISKELQQPFEMPSRIVYRCPKCGRRHVEGQVWVDPREL